MKTAHAILARASAFAAVALAMALGSTAQTSAPRITHEADTKVPGAIRIWGGTAFANVLTVLERAFRQQHPEAHFENRLMGTGTAMAGIYTGAADLAFMGRASTPKEIMAFEWVFQYKPTNLEVMTGSLMAEGRSPALVVFVHNTNPLSRISLTQLDAIFSCERRRGLPAIQTWGQLGLAGKWANSPIHAYVYDAPTGTGRFFQQVALNDSRKWAWQRVQEFKDTTKAVRSGEKAAPQILKALTQDPYGIAVAALGYGELDVKPVALSTTASGVAYPPTRQNLINRAYPLTRSIFVYFNRAPGKPVDFKIAEFLRFVLSREAQQIISDHLEFLPLPDNIVSESLKKLD